MKNNLERGQELFDLPATKGRIKIGVGGINLLNITNIKIASTYNNFYIHTKD